MQSRLQHRQFVHVCEEGARAELRRKIAHAWILDHSVAALQVEAVASGAGPRRGRCTDAVLIAVKAAVPITVRVGA
ncbi:hypothetical protein GCM10023159_25970 [Brevibacterium yomogidense]